MDSVEKLLDDCSLPPMVYVMRHLSDKWVEPCIRGRSLDELDESEFTEMFAKSIAQRAYTLGSEYEKGVRIFSGQFVNGKLQINPDVKFELDQEIKKCLFGDKLDG